MRGQSISCSRQAHSDHYSDEYDSLRAVLWGSQTTPSYGSDGGLIRPGKITCQLGDLLSSASFGHTGSVGSVAWCDPVTEMVCVICSVRSVRTGEEPTICGASCYAADSFAAQPETPSRLKRLHNLQSGATMEVPTFPQML